ncbi:MAG: hypothetical protein JW384_04124 [Nitrosomonadaceae bacterium]|nr:hypothetical protein [Nitrosomonadaceae bacterium]
MKEKPSRRRRLQDGNDSDHRVMCLPAQIPQQSAADHRHTPSKPIHSIHKVIQISHPDKKHDRDRNRKPVKTEEPKQRDFYRREHQLSTDHEESRGQKVNHKPHAN